MEWVIIGFAVFIGVIIYLWLNPEIRKKLAYKPREDKDEPKNYGEHKDILKEEWIKKP
jgi:large-conductance mechanosensitive channel